MGETTCHFDKAQYRLGENVRVHFPACLCSPNVTLLCLEREIPADVELQQGEAVVRGLSEGNYGIRVCEGDYVWEGAFDVVDSPRHIIRYGFLSDFLPEDVDRDDVAWMRDLHVNAVQFYDWMYRHDELLPREERYNDPLGRPMCLSAIKEKLTACRSMGIRPFAYGAIYAATHETFEKHPQWAMYTMDRKPLVFADWLYYMNVSEDCGWSDYLLQQYQNALRFGFAGIHMDTYGFPKHVWDYNGRPVKLSKVFPRLIKRAALLARQEHPDNGVIFNAVNNWPTEVLAPLSQEAVYVEVWPPNDSYLDLYMLIREAKLRSGKQVVLAAYMKPFGLEDQDSAFRALRLCWAAICASGGTQLVFGEKHAVLRDSYYARYAKLRLDMLPIVQKYCDFLVRYADLMYDDDGIDVSRTSSGGINEDVSFHGQGYAFSVEAKSDAIWTILRESDAHLTVHLINLRGNNDRWNEPKASPSIAESIQMCLRLDRPLRGIYCASPDSPSLSAVTLPFRWESTAEGRMYTVDLPPLEYWCTVWVEIEDD